MNKWTVTFALIALVLAVKLVIDKSQVQELISARAPICEGGDKRKKALGIEHYVPDSAPGSTNVQCERTEPTNFAVHNNGNTHQQIPGQASDTNAVVAGATALDPKVIGFAAPQDLSKVAVSDTDPKKKKKKKGDPTEEGDDTEDEEVTVEGEQDPNAQVAAQNQIDGANNQDPNDLQARAQEQEIAAEQAKLQQEPPVNAGFPLDFPASAPIAKANAEKEKKDSNQVERWVSLIARDPSLTTGKGLVTAYRARELTEDEFYGVLGKTMASPDDNIRNISIFILSQEKTQKSFATLAQSSVSDSSGAVRQNASHGLLEYSDIRYLSLLSGQLSAGALHAKIRASEVVSRLAQYYVTNPGSNPRAAAAFTSLVAILEPLSRETGAPELRRSAKSALDTIRNLPSA